MGQNSGRNKSVTKDKHYIKAQNKEKEIIQKYTNLQIDKDLKIFNVEFKFNGKDTFIHTLLSGEQNQQIIVLVHGYLATSLFYYKMIQQLSQNYKVYSIDLLGMGLSDRQAFEFQQPKNAAVATQLFVDSIEEWRKALGINSFKLAGHSFGGFISFNYHLQYPERVEQIILISPMSGSSVQSKYDLRDKNQFKKYTSTLTFKKSLFPKFLRCMHEKKMTLSKFLQSSLIPSDYFINKIIDQRFDFETKQEKEDWKTYFKYIQMLPESTDHLIHEFVSMPYVQPKISIEEIVQSGMMKEQHIPLHYIYGSDDWMDWSGTTRLLNKKKIIGSIDYIKDAGHLIPFEQPVYLVEYLSFVFDSLQIEFYLKSILYIQIKQIGFILSEEISAQHSFVITSRHNGFQYDPCKILYEKENNNKMRIDHMMTMLQNSIRRLSPSYEINLELNILVWSESQDIVDEFEKRVTEEGNLYKEEKEIQVSKCQLKKKYQFRSFSFNSGKLINIDSLKQQKILFGENGLFSSFNHGQLYLGFSKFKVTAKMCHSSCQQCKESDANDMCTECSVNFEFLNGRCILKQMFKSIKLQDFIDKTQKVNGVNQTFILLTKCYSGCISCNHTTGICKDSIRGKRIIEQLITNQFSNKLA
ncbi:hypothetical protein ABPG74_008680 [Tetrahymena malaccensis]